jgi:hypothetical protein
VGVGNWQISGGIHVLHPPAWHILLAALSAYDRLSRTCTNRDYSAVKAHTRLKQDTD